MSTVTVDKIKTAIEVIPEEDYTQLRQWFLESDWQKWDKQIEIDSESGKLNFLLEEALNEKNKRELKEL